MSIGTMIRLILILPITLAACIQMGAGEEGFKSSDRAYMQELEIALKDAGIEFRTDPDGMITYKHRDSQES